MRIVFMGTPDFAAEVLKGLIREGHEVVAAVTQPDKQKGRGNKVQYPPVKEVALSHDIPVLQPERVRGDEEFISHLRSLKPDISVVAAYGQILPEEVLEIPRFGSVNVHASLLPRLRGASPIQHAILIGDEVTGVTIMKMAKGLDTGDMISKVEVNIGDMNFSELHDKLAYEGTELLLRTLPEIEAGTAEYEKQDDAISTYAPIINKKDGHIDFSDSPKDIVNRIRAFDPWPGAYAVYNEKGENMKFWKAEDAGIPTDAADSGKVIDVDGKSFTVACGGGAVKVTEVQIPGKKRCPVEDYLRGHSLEKGFLFR